MAVIRAVLSASVILLAGCAYQLNEVNTGVSVGRTFEDGAVFAAGKTAWGVSVNGRWTKK